MKESRFMYLMERYLNEDLNEEEKLELDNWVAKGDNNKFLFNQFTELKEISDMFSDINKKDGEAANRFIDESLAKFNDKNTP